MALPTEVATVKLGAQLMPRVCTICSHPERAEIDAAAIAGTSNRVIARQFHVGHDAVLRHKSEHLLPELVKAKQAEEVSRATDLLEMATERDAKALDLLAKAEAASDLKTAGQMLRISLTSLELLARLRGDLKEQQKTTVNGWRAPEGLAAPAEGMRALGPEVRGRLGGAAAGF